MLRLIENFKKVKNFRQASGTRHQLWVVLLIIILGIMDLASSLYKHIQLLSLGLKSIQLDLS